MSQSLRERIEGLRRFSPASSGQMAENDDGRWIVRSDVLRIAAEYMREQAAVAMGVRPVAQPLSAAEELPAWLRELERLQLMACEKDQIDLRHTLAELASLRRVILSGKGEAVIPEAVQRFAWPDVPVVKCSARWRSHTLFAGPDPVTEQELLIAIDSYANALITT